VGWRRRSPRPGAEVRVGLKPEVTDQAFRSAIAAGNAEEMLERIPVNAGDAIFVPAGTVHTIGPGMVLCEVQQNSDITYRVYDFGRVDAQSKPRDLHIEKAFAVIRFGKQYGGRVSQNQRAHEAEEITLAECAYFYVTKSVFANSRHVKCQGQMKIVVVLEGRGTLRTEPGGERIEYARAQAWLVPAALRDCFFEPREQTALLSVSFPGQN
jgi:mannose-6-phosphate isomerase